MPNSGAERVRKRRENLRAAGLRPLQIWIADSRKPGFDEECRRQSRIAAAADRVDPDLLHFLDAAARDMDDFLE